MRKWLAATAGLLVLLSGCTGSSPADEDACEEYLRETLVAPFNTEGECRLVPRVDAAIGHVGIGFDRLGEAGETGYLVDLTTGSSTPIEMPEDAVFAKAHSTRIDDQPVLLVTGYRKAPGADYRPFALGFDPSGEPVLRAEADWTTPTVVPEMRVTSTNVWDQKGVLDIAAKKWTRTDRSLDHTTVEPYRRLQTTPVAMFGGNLVLTVSGDALVTGESRTVQVVGLFAVTPANAVVWQTLDRTGPGSGDRTAVAGYLGAYVLQLTGPDTGPWQIAWYDGETGRPTDPKPADLAGLRGGTAGLVTPGQLIATDDGRYLALATPDTPTNLTAVIDVEAGTVTPITTPSTTSVSAMTNTTAYLSPQHGKKSSVDLASGEQQDLSDDTKLPDLVTDEAALFAVHLHDKTMVVTR
ncbi:hypothetical protein [Enemella sp. A6]|uniref:hypothetical protein n=1 Tax=Enemella sp. A6 TaxID=3440152 RepID=UPI003EB6CDF5